MKARLQHALRPATLEPRGEIALLSRIGFSAAVEPVLDGYLGDDAKTRELAEKRLAKAVPYTAVVVAARIANEEDVARRIRLRVLYYRMLHDSWEHADAIFKAAQGLNTVARNLGPFAAKWNSAEVRKLRSRAKVLHWCFVDAKPYGKTLERNIGMTMPYRDLPAAGDLYRLAGRMYAHLAAVESDKVRKETLEANARKAEEAARSCAQSGSRAKG